VPVVDLYLLASTGRALHHAAKAVRAWPNKGSGPTVCADGSCPGPPKGSAGNTAQLARGWWPFSSS